MQSAGLDQVTTATVVIDATEVKSIKYELHTVTSNTQAACSGAVESSLVAEAGGKCTGPDADDGTYYKVGRCKLKAVLKAPGFSTWKLTYDQFRERDASACIRRHQAFALAPVIERRFRVYEDAPCYRPASRERRGHLVIGRAMERGDTQDKLL